MVLCPHPLKSRSSFAYVRHIKPIAIALAALTASTGLVAPAKADPPVDTRFTLPLFCFRFTDVKQVGTKADNNFQFEFEVLNWTSRDATRLTVNFPGIGATALNGSSLNNGVNVTTAFVDVDGRRLPSLPPVPAQPIPGNVTPTNNDWTTTFIGSPSGLFSAKSAVYDAGTPIPFIDMTGILAGSSSAAEAVAKVNALNPPGGNFPNRDFDPMGNIETIDNGTNVLDGFVFEAHDFDPGEYIVYDWKLEPDAQNAGGSGVGILARSITMQGTYNNPQGGFLSTGPTLSNLTLFAPGSPPVGSEYGFSAVLGAGVGGLENIRGVTPVPGPLPFLGAAMCFQYSRKLRKLSSRSRSPRTFLPAVD